MIEIAKKRISEAVAINNLDNGEGLTWTKGESYKLIEEEEYFSLESNETWICYINEVKEEALAEFIVEKIQ